ncbi:hypothetical protein GQ53DRAFT_838732 [Thozetella sp. PMI_491]|nr:hypothetical protein GQ53DRAFT_838732 [Thozetella sp. PMI_491]
MPVADILLPPKDMFRCSMLLGPKQTTSVVSDSKALGITVTAAWHAAVVFATRNFQVNIKIAAGKTFASFSSVNLRHFMVKLFDARAYPAGISRWCFGGG